MPAPSVIDGLKLLVVDDEPDVLETLVDLTFGKGWKEKNREFWDQFNRKR